MRRGAPARRPAFPPASQEAPVADAQLAVRVWVRVLALQKRALAALRDELEREMTMPRFDLLANLMRQDGQTLASLSRSMLVTAGNLTGLVDRAARDGLVERRADPSDRRAWRVHLTPKGQRAFRDAERRHAHRVAKLFAPLSRTELAALLRLLDKVRGSLREGPGDVLAKRPRPHPVPATKRRASAQRKSTKEIR
ncbi:MAG TPA: MarR family transcriptional regulator [Minicystis sp.]|nr:MarR family transcriptional regulator [Minicystis sp.]